MEMKHAKTDARFIIHVYRARARGCAGAAKQACRALAEPIRNVLIATPEEFPKVSIGLGGNPGLIFGAIGAATAAYGATERANELNAAVSGQGAPCHQHQVGKIKASLAAAGIQSQTMDVKSARRPD